MLVVRTYKDYEIVNTVIQICYYYCVVEMKITVAQFYSLQNKNMFKIMPPDYLKIDVLSTF